MKKLFIALITALALFLPYKNLYAQEIQLKGAVVTSKEAKKPFAGDVYAIIMGVSTYPGIFPLKYADKDARLFSNFLKTPSGGNATSENILCLINDSATAANFNVKGYRWLKKKNLKKGDRLYIYFSGHGDAMNEDNYFYLPFDCMPGNDDNNYLGTGNINMHTVKTLFIKPEVAKGVEVLLILDACRSNELPGGAAGQQGFSSYISEEKQGEIMLLSTGAGQVSIESSTIGNGHGLFTYYLVDGLAGVADKEGDNADNDGVVSLAEIAGYVKSKVKKIAREKFNTVQIPFYCCADKDLQTIATIDSSTLKSWLLAKNLQQQNDDDNLFAVNNKKIGEKGINIKIPEDPELVSLYNKFTASLTTTLTGENSAEYFYGLMAKKWPNNSITEDARYSLASELINFGQKKINLFLNGKGLSHLLNMEKTLQSDSLNVESEELNQQIKRYKTIVTANYEEAAKNMQKAFTLLSDEPDLLTSVKPKLYFLETMAAYYEKKSPLAEVMQKAQKAINYDKTAAYNYLVMGWIMQDMQNDSCEYYFNKASTIAPNWAYPYNGLGSYFAGTNRLTLAIPYFKKAIAIDSLYSDAYRNTGMVYYNLDQLDSAKKYFLKATKIPPCDPYANENYASANANYINPDFGNSPYDYQYFKIARSFYLKSIDCKKDFATAYKKLADLYVRGNKKDSALLTLQNCIATNPANDEAHRNIGNYYLNILADNINAELYLKKATELNPVNIDNYLALGRFYRRMKQRNRELSTYQSALTFLPGNKEIYNETGNAFFAAPTLYDSAIAYYNLALAVDPKLSFTYCNLGNIFEQKNEIEKAVGYFKKAMSSDSVRFYSKLNTKIGELYYKNGNFENAKKYYRQNLKSNTTFSRKTDLPKVIKILLSENNFTEAENEVNKYLLPEKDALLYTKLMNLIHTNRATNNENIPKQ